MVLEAQTMARACGKSHLHNLDPEDLVALTVESAPWPGAAGGDQLDTGFGLLSYSGLPAADVPPL
jgi:hypothetical protein